MDLAETLQLGPIWERTRGDPRICIAILDGPVDLTHPCLQDARLRQLPTVAAGPCGEGPASCHGTHITSVIFGQGPPVPGIAPECSGLIAPLFRDEQGLTACSQLDMARAILQAVDAGAHIINVSAGQLTQSSEPDPLLAKAIAYCAEKNVLIVAAAGNDGCDCIHVPAGSDGVLSVGAMDASGIPMAMSNWGGPYRSHGVLGPGVNILGAVPGGGTARKSATSFATPVVSGVVGLLLSLQLQAGEEPDPHGIRRLILKTATPCTENGTHDCQRFLAGRLNVPDLFRAIERGEYTMTEQVLMNELRGDSAEILMEPAMPPMGFGSTPLPVPPVASPPQQVTMSDAGGTALRDLVTPSCGGNKECSCGNGGGECSCGGKAKGPPPIVYALGTIGIDFSSEARRDSFTQALAPEPLLPDRILTFLNDNPFEAESITWTLNVDATPIYAILPAGPFAAQTYERLREALRGQIADGVELVSVPGYIAGSVRLLSGQVVPALIPAIRGLYSWSTQALVQSVLGPRPENEEEDRDFDRKASGLTDFLARIYYDLRNLGITPEERALNYAATNAFQAAEVIRVATEQELDLDTVTVHKSPICRPDSDCYDVELSFFNPNNTNIASRLFRFTVDVSDVIPVSIGTMRSWTRR